MKTTETPLNYCPHCNQKIDSATHFEKRISPKPGDITICGYCAVILQFDHDLRLMLCPDEEIKKFSDAEAEDIAKKRNAILEYRFNKKNIN